MKVMWGRESDEKQCIVSLSSEINNLRGKLNIARQAKDKGK